MRKLNIIMIVRYGARGTWKANENKNEFSIGKSFGSLKTLPKSKANIFQFSLLCARFLLFLFLC